MPAEALGNAVTWSTSAFEIATMAGPAIGGFIVAFADFPVVYALGAALAPHVTRFECLPHTEGCGTGYPDGGIDLYSRIMLGHLTHPSVALALCLEHGCEKTHNDFMTGALTEAHIDPARFGYASIQLDGAPPLRKRSGTAANTSASISRGGSKKDISGAPLFGVRKFGYRKIYSGLTHSATIFADLMMPA